MLSIITPTLNEEKYLPSLLASIKSQPFSDYEIIVSDGKISISGSGNIAGSGQTGSYILLITTSTCPVGSCGGGQGADAIILTAVFTIFPLSVYDCPEKENIKNKQKNVTQKQN